MNYELEAIKLMKEICDDFDEYQHLPGRDKYKGKIKGGHNIYYKYGKNHKSGIYVGVFDTKKFNLKQFPYNFVTTDGFGKNEKDQYGWCDEEMINVLNHIKKCVC